MWKVGTFGWGGRGAAGLALIGLLAMPACGDDDGEAGPGVEDVADTAEDGFVPVDTAGPADTSAPTDTISPPDGEVVPGGFGWPCQGNPDCLDGFCVEGEEGYFCTRNCIEDCPDGLDCRSVVTPGQDPVFLCLPRLVRLCVPCAADFQCTGGACLSLDGGRFCGSTCGSADDCPAGYDCAPDAAGAHTGTYCQPRSRSCACTPEAAGSLRTCSTTNAIGTCLGVETCDPEVGWVGCTARTAAPEVCDGVDNDCNGLVDDGVGDGDPCENTVEGVGTCTGVQICIGSQGMTCTAAVPEPEVCDFRDNNCDGQTDEDFKDEHGAWTLDTHCGGCFNDCTTRIPNGTGRCEVLSGTPVCVVAECDPDYIAINQFQCALPPDVSCQPCQGDGDCYGGSCRELDGQQVCVSPCGATAGACAPGFTCADIGGGVERCMPVTGSCVCSALTDGQLRTCSRSNFFGTCFGQQTCDGTSGWTECSARVPAAEVCDGVDNDCNGLVDDGVTSPAEACENTVEGVGTCTGQWFCRDEHGVGEVGWTCSAPTPEPEVCDFRDNNCDGLVDTGFRDPATGIYTSDEACGSCGIACAGAIPNATATCTVTGSTARCEVLQCNEGFYRAGPLTCLPVGDDLCTPCLTDAQCPTPGDRCLSLDGGGFCGRDCGADNLHGEPAGACPTGYECAAVSGGPDQCVPVSGSCSCLPPNDGATRPCVRANAIGTCYGQEVCDPELGWVGCTVGFAEPERCDGVDNDCNNVVDDVPGRGGACANANQWGSCAGVLDCQPGSQDLVCAGRIPAEDVCNYIDDDCSGVTDATWAGELFTSCSAGLGVCQRFGFRVCTADGAGTECNATPGPVGVELCDGLDNDCNGLTDEHWPDKGQPCVEGQGICRVTGVLVCSPNGQSLTCSATPGTPQAEVCDGLDNNCSGVVDDPWAHQLGQICDVGQGQCRAFGNLVCNSAGDGVTCNATPGIPQAEVCDGQDNDCDGVTDNGFQVNGRYIHDTTCGNCFTDCTAIFDVDNGYGRCNSAPATPRCQLHCCRAGDGHGSCDGGDYFDLNGVPDDGCEFELDPLGVYVSATDPAATNSTGCGLAPTQTGLGFPCRTISYGIQRAQALGRVRVLVAGGAYPETVTVVDGVSLFGGYNPLNWTRDPAVNLSSIFGSTPSGHRTTVIAQDITAHDTWVDGFTIYGQNAGGVAENSYAVYVRASNGRLRLRDNLILAGSAGPGASGARGGDGASGGGGNTGANARQIPGNYSCFEQCNAPNPKPLNAGGGGGTNSACGSAAGGRGGHSACPNFDERASTCDVFVAESFQTVSGHGVAGQGGARGGAGGEGGCDSLIDPDVTQCACRPPSAHATCPQGDASLPGHDGSVGAAGSSGVRCTSPGGQVVSSHWRGFGGLTGGAGGAGGGGGGGGAGGGVEEYHPGAGGQGCASGYSDFGGAGGGGGAGGCGGGGGAGGQAPGGSFGVFVMFPSNPGTNVPIITGNDIRTGFGGAGGRGGDAGTPGTGGPGGAGGAGGVPGDLYWCSRPGARGGQGGTGGPGAGGGGACGGVSYGIFVAGSFSAGNLSGWVNAITLAGAGGPGGPGGLTSAGGNVGQDGLPGTHAEKNF